MLRTVTPEEVSALLSTGQLDPEDELRVVDDTGRTTAIVLGPAIYERVRHLTDPWAIVEEIRARNADKAPDAVLADITEIVDSIRREQYEHGA